MSGSALRRAGETGRAALLAFTAVTLGLLQFVQHALPSPDIVWVSSEIVLITLGVWIVIPTAVLTIVDRVVESRFGAGSVARFRAVVFALAAVLFLRSLQIYFGAVGSLLDPLGPLALLAYVAVAIVTFRFVSRKPAQAYQAGLYLSFVAVLLLLFAPVQMTPKLGNPPDSYGREVPTIGSDRDPVFVFVLDELSYNMLQDGTDFDGARYPNIAGLKQDSVWLTDASSNYLHTSFIVPGFIDAAGRLSGEYDVRVYDQYAYVESFVWDDCGVVFTCIGATRFGAERQAELAGIVSRRAAYQAAPAALEPIVGNVFGWVDGDLDAPSPAVDTLGMHTFTDLQFRTFLDDIESESTTGRLHFVHLLLPHEPYVYDGDGNVVSSPGDTNFEVSDDTAAVDERYRLQLQYLDSLIGQFVEKLRAEGLYESATIVLTGDHGIRRHQVNENDEVGPEGVPVDDDVTRVPFLMKAPGLAPSEWDVSYQHTDFEATLRDLLKAPANGSGGVSAFVTDRPERPRVFYIDQKNDRYWKYIRNDATGAWDLADYVVGQMPEEPENFASTVD